jgi:hypothetical protein
MIPDLSLPRQARRKAYLKAYRADNSVRWENYRRWDGGKPNILKGFDALRDLKKTMRAFRKFQKTAPSEYEKRP